MDAGWSAPRLARSLIVLLLAGVVGRADTTLTGWTPIYQGVDHAVGTNTPGGGTFQNLQVAHFIRVDLRDPDVQLFSSPRMLNYRPNAAETPGYTVSTFLRINRLQVAINANYFDPQEYYLPAGTRMDISGLSVCEGTVVSAQDNRANAAALLVTQANEAQIIHTNWPPAATAGIYTAVSGMYPVLVNGVNVGYRYLNDSDFVHRVNPRTAIGLSQDRRHLLLLAIDGRQSGYSAGAYDWETAGWLLLAGAYDGINMDGGGSTTLVMQDSTGAPVRLNKPSAVADSGRERTVGSHFGVFARPVPGFINDLVATPDDTTAVITWNTTSPASSQVQYGPTPDLPLLTPPTSTLLTNHSVLLRDLSPATSYYFRALSQADGREYASSNLVFTTTNYVTTGQLFDLEHPWTFTVGNLDGVPWTSPSFDDATWTGAGPGLLWVDTRATGPLPEVQPRNTEMPPNPDNNGFPYITYYFRTHFAFAGNVAGVSLSLSNYLDDGAVFYLNGVEVQRLYLPPAPEEIAHDTLADDYYCEDGNATCPLVFTLTDAAANLRPGDNVLAVEVHNYALRSPDVTFGCALHYTQPAPRQPVLSIERVSEGVSLSWDRSGFTLQSAADPAGPWMDVPGPVTESPHTLPPSAAAACYRLRQ